MVRNLPLVAEVHAVAGERYPEEARRLVGHLRTTKGRQKIAV